MEPQKTQKCQSNPEPKEQSWKNNPFRLQTILQNYSNQNSVEVVQKQTYRSMEENGEPRNKPCAYGQIVYDKGGKDIQWRKDSLFNKWYWKSWTVTCKSMKLEHFLIQYTQIKSKWFKDISVKSNTIKLLEESIGKTFSDANRSNIFLGPSLKAK